jgi:hypothetical protein
VIAKGPWVGTGKGSGVRVESSAGDYSALRFQEGKVVETIWNLPDKETALEAAGLSE